jgi:phenylalanyl-tRNA synthetase alpha chain
MSHTENLKAKFDAACAAFVGSLSQSQPGSLRHRFDEFKSAYVGKKGEIQGLLRQMGSLSADEKPVFGKLVNALRDHAEAALQAIEVQVEEADVARSLAKSQVDATLPGRRIPLGTLHPLTQVREGIIDYFVGLGFTMAEAPEIDHDWYNFEALNIPPEHPARDMQDTFHVGDGVVLRTHTSNVQVHYMLEHKNPPLRMIAPGVVYRVDNDATHSPMFNQVECLVVDQGISFADLRGTLSLWAENLFGKGTRLRFRPSFFPFTEPSAEMDVSCPFCKGNGCRVCKQSGWIEIGGCGSVDPNVFASVGWDSEKFSGFAFGFGIDRIAIIQYGVPDIGMFFRNDVRFLRQF